MKKLIMLGLCLALLTGAVAGAETLTGMAKGFGGTLTVAVTMDGDKITAVEVTEHSETNGIGTPAIEQLPAAIVEANSTEVDAVAGATVTSKAIIAAVNNAIDPEQYPFVEEEPAPAPSEIDSDLYMGFGMSAAGRIGPGSDSTETPVYSFNVVMANAIFDRDGRIVSLFFDQLEVATPNYDGDGMPHFSGFPGQGGYNWDEKHDGTIVGKTEDTEDNYLAEIASWQTKRERGDSYVMGTGTWTQQANAFGKLFVGMTVDEADAWFTAYCSDRNGRPLQDGSTNEQDAAKYAALSDEDKAMLADVTSSATMSLNDSHGNLLEALREAFDNRAPLVLE